HHAPLEVEPLEVGYVVILAGDRRGAEKRLHPAADIERGEIVLQARRRFVRRAHDGPVGGEAAQDEGLTALDDLALEALGIEVPTGDLFRRESHGSPRRSPAG